MGKGIKILNQHEFYDEVHEEGYSGVPVNWVKDVGEPSLDENNVSKLIECGQIFSGLSWAQGTSGNLSFKSEGGIGVTATRTKLGELVKEDIVEVINIHYQNENPTVIYKSFGDKKPTSEVLAHWEVYEGMGNIRTILHGHDNLTTRMARIISNHSPDLAGRTVSEPLQGTKEFAYDLRDIAKPGRRYLISKGHGFFSLGEDFDEALDYATLIHYLTRASQLPVYFRQKLDSLIPAFLKGRTAPLTDKLEGFTSVAIKLGVPRIIMKIRSR